MTADSDRDYTRLAELAHQRRVELGLSIVAAAQAAEASKGTFQRVERGMAIRESSYARIDAALQWAPGSCRSVLEGGEPVLVREAGESGVQISPISVEAIDGQARDVVQLALIATAKGTTAEEIREISERVVRDLRERGLL
jgi:hypothetical protein